MYLDWISPMMAQSHEKDDDNVIPMVRPDKGGKEPPKTDWLRELPIGTIFLCGLSSNYEIYFSECTVLNKTGKAVLLEVRKQNAHEFNWVNSATYSEYFKLIEILYQE